MAADKSTNAVFNLFAYDANNKLSGNGFGFFIGEDGTAVAPYELLKNASYAELIDNKGKTFKVTRILGANSFNGLVKFATDTKKVTALPISQHGVNEGTLTQLVRYSREKNGSIAMVKIEKATDYDSLKYYDLNAENAEKNFGCPLINTAGEVVGIVQKNVQKNATKACAIDARFISKLNMTALSALNSDLNNIHIPKALPPTQNDALTYIYMLQNAETANKASAFDDFIAFYPDNAEGYVNRASFLARQGNLEAAENDFNEALKKAENKESTITIDGIHFTFSKLIAEVYYAEASQGKSSKWTLEKALQEATSAYQVKHEPLYRQQEANLLFDLKQYKQAATYFSEINQTTFATAETFLQEAGALKMAGADSLAIMVCLDSMITRIPRPYTIKDATFFQTHAQQATLVGDIRKAINSWNEYEKIVGPEHLNAQFYYDREQLGRKARMYQQALADIRTAQAKANNEAYHFFRLEEASLLLQVGMYEEAIISCTGLLDQMPNNTDCLKILGLAYQGKGDKLKSKQYLQKAANLGDEQAKRLLSK